MSWLVTISWQQQLVCNNKTNQGRHTHMLLSCTKFLEYLCGSECYRKFQVHTGCRKAARFYDRGQSVLSCRPENILIKAIDFSLYFIGHCICIRKLEELKLDLADRALALEDLQNEKNLLVSQLNETAEVYN